MIKLLTHTDLPAALAYMNRHYLETALLIENVLACGLENRREDSRSGDYFGCFEGRELTGIAAFYNAASCIPHYERQSAAQELSILMLKRNFRTMLGLQKIVKPLLPILQGRKPIRHLTESEYLVNHNFRPYEISGAGFQTVSQLGAEKAADFIARAYGDMAHDGKSRYGIQKQLQDPAATEEFLFLLIDGDIKAQAYIKPSTAKVAQIGAVYTLDAERGRGYCKAITSELCARIIRLGKTPALTVRQDNLPAKRAYERIGFSCYDRYLLIKF